MAANDVYSVTVQGGNSGAETRNVFFYKASPTSSSATAASLRGGFMLSVMVDMRGILSTGWPVFKVVTLNLFNPTDWEEFNITPILAGTRTGERAVQFLAVAFKSAKPASNQQPARKRFGYLSESDISSGAIVGGGAFETALAALATELGQSIVVGGTQTYAPVIVKRIKYTTDEGNVAYRLPTALGEAVTYPAISWVYDPIISPQITRKFGRGV